MSSSAIHTDSKQLYTDAKGVPIYTSEVEQMMMLWESGLRNQLSPFYKKELEAPDHIHRETLERSNYLTNFPQQVVDRPGDYEDDKEFLSPAACLNIYPTLAGRIVDAQRILVSGRCFRHESGTWEAPYRLSQFSMLEVVAIGSESDVLDFRSQVLTAVESWFRLLGLPISVQNATDVFYLDGSRGARILQQLLGLKKELLFKTDSGQIALASINNHQEYFGRRFDIRQANRKFAFSSCAAFGIERLTAAGIETWGSIDKWPAALMP